MTGAAHRRPGAVPDDDGVGLDGTVSDATGADVRGGLDTDGDGRSDTLLTPDGADLLVLTDLDGDGLADRVLRIGPDGSVHADAGHADVGPADVAYVDFATGSAPAHTPWDALLGRLLGP